LVIQTGNSAEFQFRFHWHLKDLDIHYAYIQPRTPHLNGKVERSHRVDDQEFYKLLNLYGIADDIHLINAWLREWEDYYDYHRPRGALYGHIPIRAASGKDHSRRVTSMMGS
jgi:transposase InsO family protein